MIRMLLAFWIQARPDWRAERHHGRGARFFELAADDRIVVRIRQHHEPFAHEHACGFEERDVVGEERALVADHLELHPVREPRLAPEPRRANRVVRRVTAGGVRQQEVLRRVDVSRSDPLPRSLMFTRRRATVTTRA
jgi:hypothetical protein